MFSPLGLFSTMISIFFSFGYDGYAVVMDENLINFSHHESYI